jgi:hypothetical protein
MTALARRNDAVQSFPAHHSANVRDLWQDAIQIRHEWLDSGLSTKPADRATAERCLTGIYARMLRPQPRFVWVDSPRQALPQIVGVPTLEILYSWIRGPRPAGTPPLASDLAALVSRLRSKLGEGVGHADPEQSPVRRGKNKESWPQLPPRDALAAGAPLGVVLHQGVRQALHRSLAEGLYLPVRRALADDGPVPVSWYGQQDASWIAYYDALQRLGLARYGPDESGHLGEWAALARSCGWWWPGDGVCVVAERPEMVHTEPVAGAWHEEVRLVGDGVAYRDGWRPRC